MIFTTRVGLVAVLVSLTVPILAQEKKSVPGYKFTAPPVIDGTIDESAEWAGAPSFEGLWDTRNDEAARDNGKFWLGYDEKYIYFAARLADANPKGIRATEYRTNVSFSSDDRVGLVIDPFGTSSGLNFFSINPRGATEIEIAGGRAPKREWLGDMLAKGRITETGWEVEARIPWAVMKLPGKGTRDLTVDVYRYQQSVQRQYAWSRISGNRVENFGRWLAVELPPAPPRTLKLLPYGYIGASEDEGFIANGGLDMKTSITDQLEFVGSINPDFRNIENDILSLDFSYFERLAGESRPFFLEGIDFFRTSNDAPLFISQRIGSFDAGAKVFGKLGPKTNFAFLNTADFGEENAFVVNASHRFTERTTLQGAFASLDRDGLENQGSFLNFGHSVGATSFFATHMQTQDSELESGQRFNAGTYHENGPWFALAEYTSITSRFLPRLGFAPERNFHGFNGNIDYLQPIANGPLMETAYSLFYRKWDRFDGEPYREQASVNGSVTWRNGLDLDLGVEFQEFQGNKDRLYFASIELPRGDSYRHWQVDYQFGRLAGQDYRSTSLSAAYRPMERLQLSARYQQLKFNGTSDQFILSGSYDLGADRSIVGRAVKTDEDWNAYVAYRRSGNKGIEYFLILGDPNARQFKSNLILKVVYPLEVLLGR